MYWKERLVRKENSAMSFVDSIFIDEVHERSFFCDIITGTVKDLHKKEFLPSKLKIIICSATINKAVFCEFFYDCNVIEIEGSTHPITDYYRPPHDSDKLLQTVEGVVEEVLLMKIKGSTEPVDGHMLIFVDSIPNINALQGLIEKLICRI